MHALSRPSSQQVDHFHFFAAALATPALVTGFRKLAVHCFKETKQKRET